MFFEFVILHISFVFRFCFFSSFCIVDVLFGLELLNKLNNGNDGTCRCLLKYSSVNLYLNFAVSASYPKIRLIRIKELSIYVLLWIVILL